MDIMSCINGKVAMVTGGATGLGAAIVEHLAGYGADVACCYNRSGQAAQKLAERLAASGRNVLPVQMDVTDGAQVAAAVSSIAAHFGRPVSILVNNAGDMVRNAPLDEMPEDLWDRVIGINLRGAYLCAKYCIPGMKSARWGRIINISSQSARTGGGPGAVHYVTSKAGLEGFTRGLAKELAPHNIIVNALAPGDCDTDMLRRFNPPENLERLKTQNLFGRLGRPAEIAQTVCFLASDAVTFMAGTVVAVNGGKRMD